MALTIVHTGRKIRVGIDVTTLPDGREIRRDAIFHPGAAVILPVLADGRICLLRNQRFVVGETLWELPAGTLEANEPPEQAAVRELEEETGYRAARWRKLAAFYASPGVMNEILHLFVAQDLTPGPTKLEADEEIEPQLVPFEQALAWALDGTIRDGKTITALLLWDRLKDSSGST